jgi:hypothetical protein
VKTYRMGENLCSYISDKGFYNVLKNLTPYRINNSLNK